MPSMQETAEAIRQLLTDLPPGEQSIGSNGIVVTRHWKHVNQFQVELPDGSYHQKLRRDQAIALIMAHTA